VARGGEGRVSGWVGSVFIVRESVLEMQRERRTGMCLQLTWFACSPLGR